MKCKRVFLSVLSVMLILASGCHAVSAESAESPEPAPQSEFALKILIDPGHQGSNVDMSAPEPNGPGSSVTKAKATTGAAGDYTRVPEYQLNLDISLMLRDELTARGYEVFMTRTDNDTAISNKERAEMASAVQADIFVRIHANSSTDHSVSGACTMAPSPSNPYVSHLSPESERLSRSILDGFRTIPKIYVEAGKNIGLDGLRLIFGVYVPASFANMLSGIKVGWARAWRGLISAEMIFGAARTAGIGVFINNARTVWIDYPSVYAALILIILVGVIVEYGVFQVIEKLTVKKWGMIQ